MTAGTFQLQVDLPTIAGPAAQDGRVRIEPLANEAGTYPVVDPDTGALYVAETYDLGRTGSRTLELPKPTDMVPVGYQYRATVTYREATGRYFKSLPSVTFDVAADTVTLELGNLVDTSFVPPEYVPELLQAKTDAQTAATAAAASATDADASATAAGVSEANAAQSATDAQASADAAAAPTDAMVASLLPPSSGSTTADALDQANADLLDIPDGVFRNKVSASIADKVSTDAGDETTDIGGAVLPRPTADLGDWALLRRDTSDVSKGVSWSTPSAAVARALGWAIATDYGVTLDGTTDDTAAYQAFFDDITVNAKKGYVPDGTVRLTGAINVNRRPGWQVHGAGPEKTIVLMDASNIPIYALGAVAGSQLHTYGFWDMKHKYAVAQTGNTAANVFQFKVEAYWGTYQRLVFENCYWGYQVDSGIGGPWGTTWDELRFTSSVRGGAMDWSLCANAVPNNHFGRLFVDATNMVGPIFSVRGYDFTIDTIEFAAVFQGAQLMVFAPGTRVVIGAIKLENGTWGGVFDGKSLIELQGQAFAKIGHVNFGGSTNTLNIPGGGLYLFGVNIGAGSGGFLRVDQIDVQSWSTLTAGTPYVFNVGSNGRASIGNIYFESGWALYNSVSSTTQQRVRLDHAINDRLSVDRGNNNIVLSLGNENIQMFNTALTAPRTIDLPSIGVGFSGLYYKIVSKGAVNGANTIAVRSEGSTIATLSADNTSVTCVFRRSTSREWVVLP